MRKILASFTLSAFTLLPLVGCGTKNLPPHVTQQSLIDGSKYAPLSRAEEKNIAAINTLLAQVREAGEQMASHDCKEAMDWLALAQKHQIRFETQNPALANAVLSKLDAASLIATGVHNACSKDSFTNIRLHTFSM